MCKVKVTLFELYPSMRAEWLYEKNLVLGVLPEMVTSGSHKRVWWRCAAGHEWEAVVYCRTSGNGCPYCSGRRALPHNCLATVNPKLAAEWHPEKNLTSGLTPEIVTTRSDRKVWWRCSSGHEWQAIIKNRTNKDGCTICSGKTACYETCLSTTHPDLSKQWHPAKNMLTPEGVVAGSNKKVWWLCDKGHEWCATIHNRSAGSGCPHCSGGAISKISQAWLDSLGIPAEFREYPIKLSGRKHTIRVDGFDPTTNTAYEFLGNYWHGNPEVFDPEGVNPRTSEKYGVLYRRTLRRLELLKKAGYTVVFIWERDFKINSSNY